MLVDYQSECVGKKKFFCFNVYFSPRSRIGQEAQLM